MNGVLIAIGTALTAIALILSNLMGQFAVLKDEAPKIALGQSRIAGNISTTTIFTADTTARQIFATSTCNSRVVSTGGQGGVMLTFKDRHTPTSRFGVYQPASTTKEYYNSEYGCGLVRVYASPANLMTVQETQ